MSKHKISRRKFLGSALVGGAGLAAMPAVLPAGSPNEKLGVAVVGIGGRGMSHLQAFISDPRTEVRYIVEVDSKHAGRAEVAARKQGVKPKVVRDLREALMSKDVDIVSTATPNHWHALVGVWAMQAGKDVYLEKPISHEIAEGAALVAAAKKYRRMCQVGTQCRSNPAIIPGPSAPWAITRSRPRWTSTSGQAPPRTPPRA